MKQNLWYGFIVTILWLGSSCSQLIHNDQIVLPPPELNDKGKTIDSLKKTYDCENVDFENWNNKSASDSCLTVCLKNSTRVPSDPNGVKMIAQLKGIAAAVRKSLVSPEKYRSIYILFVKKEKQNGMDVQVHSAGMEIPSAQL